MVCERDASNVGQCHFVGEAHDGVTRRRVPPTGASGHCENSVLVRNLRPASEYLENFSRRPSARHIHAQGERSVAKTTTEVALETDLDDLTKRGYHPGVMHREPRRRQSMKSAYSRARKSSWEKPIRRDSAMIRSHVARRAT